MIHKKKTCSENSPRMTICAVPAKTSTALCCRQQEFCFFFPATQNDANKPPHPWCPLRRQEIGRFACGEREFGCFQRQEPGRKEGRDDTCEEGAQGGAATGR